MPFTKRDLEQAPISFCKENEACVIVGPCSQSVWDEPKIPLDGRKYCLGGKIILRNNLVLRASFTIDTTTFDFLVKPSAYVYLNEVWYKLDEPELLEKLGLTYDEAFPFKWSPDRELNYREKGPYKSDWYSPD
jgi:hypothetical protein